MNKILFKNDLGESVIANVLRYFKFNDDQYMIYSLNEIDESDYMKLYGVKIELDQDNEVTAKAIDDSAWSSVVSLIKDIVRAKTQGEKIDVNDLNFDFIDSINLISKRVFKINKDMANLLLEEEQQEQEQFESSDTNEDNDETKSAQSDNKLTEEFNSNSMSIVQPFEMPNLNLEDTNLEDATEGIQDDIQGSIDDNQISSQNQNNTDDYNYKELYEKLLEQNKSLIEENDSLRAKITGIESILRD
ncbi:MAG: hypothetical protein NC181_00270 [Clostridium sp.]|nr:hypothetical protein [Clostridium sp.]MCM1443889.1 hypothetical protein [Candidatus Amulumruptor caecigallinarius]